MMESTRLDSESGSFMYQFSQLQARCKHTENELMIREEELVAVKLTIDDLTSKLVDSFAKCKLQEDEIMNCRKEIEGFLSDLEEAKYKIEFLEKDLDSHRILSLIRNDDKACQFYTGLNSYERLWTLFNFTIKYTPAEHVNCKLPYLDQFVLTLVRLRLNLTMQDLAYRFKISLTTCSRYIAFWLHAMYSTLVPAFIRWPKRENVRKTLPLAFRDRFACCICIIDCFEIFLDRPIQLKERASTFSNYKSHNTVKFLIAITPQGYISYISKAYGGRASDKFIVEDCGFLDLLVYGDVVLADRGFTVHEAVALQHAELKVPSFAGKKNQLSQVEVELSRDLARVRVHVERVIGAIKQRYSILEGTLCHQSLFVTVSDEERISTIDKMVNVACALYNACPSVVPLV